MLETEQFTPCLIDPRRNCLEECRLHEVAQAKLLYLKQSSRTPVTEESIATIFSEKTEKEIAAYLTTNITNLDITGQLHKCDAFIGRE